MASEYHRGDMDIHEQKTTYHAFGVGTKWGCVALASLLIFLVLYFCTDVSFFPAIGTGVLVLVLGIVFLREKKGGGH